MKIKYDIKKIDWKIYALAIFALTIVFFAFSSQSASAAIGNWQKDPLGIRNLSIQKLLNWDILLPEEAQCILIMQQQKKFAK